MAKVTLEFNEEHIKLIKNLRFKKINIQHEKTDLTMLSKMIAKIISNISDEEYETEKGEIEQVLARMNEISKKSKAYADEDNDRYYGIDTYDLYDSDFWYHQMAYILGYADQVIDGTLEDIDGPKYPKEIIEHLRELDNFITENLNDIEDLIHQFCDKGGIQADVKYVSYDHEKIWHTEAEWKEMGRR